MSAKTKNFIVSEYLKLLETNEFDKITVTDLVDHCSISRQTFYYHFDDIYKMIEWAFQIDSDNICSKIKKNENTNGSGYIYFYTDFMNKYETLLKKSINTSQFIYIYNLLEKFFFVTTKEYFMKSYKSFNSSHNLIIRFWSNAILGFVINELQKNDSDYNAVFKTLYSYIPKQNKE